MSITWNSSDKSANITLSNGNLTTTATSTAWKSARATEYKSSGKWYWEVTINVAASDYCIVGIGTSIASISSYCGSDSYGYGYNGYNGYSYHNRSTAVYGNTFTLNDVIGVALDMDNGKLWFSKNGTWQNSGVPASGTGEAFSGISGNFYPMISPYSSTSAETANFGATAFSYSIPTGFKKLDFIQTYYYFTGFVYENDVPASRQLYAYNRDSGELMQSTVSSGDGYFYVTTTYSGEHFVVALDNVSGTGFNDKIIGKVVPITVL